MRAHEVPVKKTIITTILSKDLDEYESVGPHVAAARKMKALGLDVGPGSRIEFVIAKGKGLIRDKVKLPKEASDEDYDAEYYVEHQILPGVERIFDALGFSTDDLAGETSQSTLGNFY